MSFFSEYSEVNKLLKEKHPVVFYAENRHYFQYYEKLINDLLKLPATKITYITSDEKDPLLNAPGQIRVVYIKWMLGFLFSRVRADVMVMTMPDLDNFLFKKSKSVGCYVYMFHAAVSTHQQYRKKAFFHYDAIFCVGTYHEQELQMAELLYHQRKKMLIPYGYPLLDKVSSYGSAGNGYVLIAPSWFEGCIFDTCLQDILVQLAALPYKVVIRSHPEYEKRKKRDFAKIKKIAAGSPAITIDSSPHVIQSLAGARLLITDRSGIAFEYALGLGRPVLFIDTALKQVNPDWKELNIAPIENEIREQLGVTLPLSQLDQLAQKIEEAGEMAPGFEIRMQEMKKQLFFNSEDSYKKGVDFILSKINGN